MNNFVQSDFASNNELENTFEISNLFEALLCDANTEQNNITKDIITQLDIKQEDTDVKLAASDDTSKITNIDYLLQIQSIIQNNLIGAQNISTKINLKNSNHDLATSENLFEISPIKYSNNQELLKNIHNSRNILENNNINGNSFVICEKQELSIVDDKVVFSDDIMQNAPSINLANNQESENFHPIEKPNIEPENVLPIENTPNNITPNIGKTEISNSHNNHIIQGITKNKNEIKSKTNISQNVEQISENNIQNYKQTKTEITFKETNTFDFSNSVTDNNITQISYNSNSNSKFIDYDLIPKDIKNSNSANKLEAVLYDENFEMISPQTIGISIPVTSHLKISKLNDSNLKLSDNLSIENSEKIELKISHKSTIDIDFQLQNLAKTPPEIIQKQDNDSNIDINHSDYKLSELQDNNLDKNDFPVPESTFNSTTKSDVKPNFSENENIEKNEFLFINQDKTKQDNFDQNDDNHTQYHKGDAPVFSNINFGEQNIAKNKFENILDKNNSNLFKYKEVRNVTLQDYPQVVMKYAQNLQHNSNGTVKLVMTPESLGTIFVEVNSNDEKLTINFKSDNSESLQAIEKNIGSLKELFNKTSTNDVEYRFEKSNDNLKDQFFDKQNHNKNNKQDEQGTRRNFVNSIANIAQDEPKNDFANKVKYHFKQGKIIEKYV